MATAKDGIEYLIEAKVSKAIANLKKFDKKTKGSAKKTTSALSKMKAGWGGLAAIMGGAVVGGIIALGVSMVKASARMESTRVSFETFTGSVEAGAKIMKELQDFSIVTPFTIDQVNKAAKTLLAFGTTADEVKGTLKLIGDVSAGTGKDLGEMAVIFGQVKSMGKLMGQDLLQLINAGFNPLAEIARTTGKSMVSLKEEMSKGLISFDMLEGAFESATSKGGLFFDMMDKQSKTLAGRISTLTGNVDLMLAAFGDELAPTVGIVVDKLNKFITTGNNVQKAIKGIVIALKFFGLTLHATLLPAEVAVRSMINAFSSLSKAASALKKGEIIESIKNIGLATAAIPRGIGQSAKSVTNQMKDFAGSIKEFFEIPKKEEEKLTEVIKKEAKKRKKAPVDDKAQKKKLEDLKSFNKKTADLAFDASEELLGDLLSFNKETADLAFESSEQKLKDQEDFLKKKEAKDKEAADKELEMKKKVIQMSADLALAGFNTAVGLVQALLQTKLDALATETEALLQNIPQRAELEAIAQEEELERIADLELERDEALASGDERGAREADRELEKIQLTKELAKEEDAIRTKQAKKESVLRRKQAVAERIAGIFSVVVSTAMAITKSIAALPLLGGLPFSAINAALGAVQIATIAAKPLPKILAQGTGQGGFITNGPELLLVGDNQGGRERVNVDPISSGEINRHTGNTYNFNGINDLSAARNELMLLEGEDAWQ